MLLQTYWFQRSTRCQAQHVEIELAEPQTLMLDGALVNGNYRAPGRAATYGHTNNFIVRELSRRHGHDVNFLGMVIGRGWQDSRNY